MKKAGIIALVILILQGCSFFATTPPKPVVLSDAAVQVRQGETVRVTATAGTQGSRSATGASGLTNLHWNVKDSTIASVFGTDGVCVITGIDVGQTTVRASTDDSYAEVLVEVLPSATGTTGGIRISKSIIPLSITQQETVFLQTMDDATPVQWSTTGNPTDAPVFQLIAQGTQAMVIGRSAGTATITATQGSKTAAATVYGTGSSDNTDSSSPYITSAFPTISMTKNVETSLSVMLIGLQSKDEAGITWTETQKYSATPKLSILSNGASALVTGLVAGVTSIEISHPKVPSKYTILVRVTDSGAAQVMALSKTSSVIGVTSQDLITATLTNAVENDYFNIQWTVDDPTVVSVLGNGRTVTLLATKVGRTTLHAKYLSSTERTVDVVVQGAGGVDTYISTLNSMSLVVGNSKDTTAAIIGNVPGSANSGLVWTSEDSTIVSTFGQGTSATLTAVKAGIVKVNITHPQYPNLSATILVRVVDQATSFVSKPITVDSSAKVIYDGQQFSLSATIQGAEPGDYSAIQWTIDNGTILNPAARILGDGQTITVLGLNAGEATIKASLGTYSARCQIVVQSSVLSSGGDSYIQVQNAVSLVTGNTKDLTAAIIGNLPGSATSSMVWTSDTPTVATVFGSGSSGSITAVSPGLAKIKIAQSAYNLESYVLVRVQDGSATTVSKQVTLDMTSKVLVAGQQFSLNAFIDGGLTSDYPMINWAVEVTDPANPPVRFIGNSQTITVLALAAGSAKITATLGTYKATCDILVQASASGTDGSIYISSPSATISVDRGTVQALTATLVGAGMPDQSDLTWTSSDSSVVTVFGAGQSIQMTAVGAGKTVVTVSHHLAPVSYKIFVQVNEPNITVSLSQNALSTYLGTQTTLSATIHNGGSSSAKDIVWSIQGLSSGDPSPILVIGSGGSVIAQAVATGHVRVRATLPNGQFDECDTYVSSNSGGSSPGQLTISTNRFSYQLNAGVVQIINAQLDGGTAYQTSQLTWSIDNPAVCRIIGAGPEVMVNTLAAGEATITISHPAVTQTQKIYISVNASNKAVSLPETALSMQVGDQRTMTASIPNGTALELTSMQWSSNNNSIVQAISGGASGILVAKNSGVATITVSANGCISGTIVINVTSTTADSKYISMSPGVDSLFVGDQRTYRATLIGGTAAEQNDLVWSRVVGNNVTIVGSGGSALITATDTGTATIEVSSAKYPLIKGTLSLSISAISYGLTMSMSTVTVGPSQTINVVASGQNLTQDIINTAQWGLLSNGGGISVTPSGLNAIVMSGTSTGISEVFCKVKLPNNQYLQTSMLVNVQKPITSTADKYFTASTSILNVTTGQVSPVSVIYNNATQDDYGYIRWSILPDTNNTNVVSVIGNRESANITALKAGTATVLVSDSRGGVNNLSIVVTVRDLSQAVSLSPASVTIKQGEMVNVTASIPGGQDQDYQSITYKVVYLDAGVPRKEANGTYTVNPTALISTIQGRTVSVSAQNPSTNCYLMAFLPGGESKAVYTAITIQQNSFITVGQSSVNLSRFGTSAQTSATVPISVYPTVGGVTSTQTNSDVVDAVVTQDVNGANQLILTAKAEGTSVVRVTNAVGNSTTVSVAVSSTANLTWYTTQASPTSVTPGATLVLKYNLLPWDASVSLSSVSGLTVGSPVAISGIKADGSKDYSLNVTPTREGSFAFTITHGTKTSVALGVTIQSSYSDADVLAMLNQSLSVPADGYFVQNVAPSVASTLSQVTADASLRNGISNKIVLLRNTSLGITAAIQGANAGNMNNPLVTQAVSVAASSNTDLSGAKYLYSSVNGSGATLSYNLGQNTDHTDATQKYLGTYTVSILHGYNRTQTTTFTANIYGTSLFVGVSDATTPTSISLLPGETKTYTLTVFPPTASVSFSGSSSGITVQASSLLVSSGKKYTVSVLGVSEGNYSVQAQLDSTSATYFSIPTYYVTSSYGAVVFNAPSLVNDGNNIYHISGNIPLQSASSFAFTITPSVASVAWTIPPALMVDSTKNDGKTTLGFLGATTPGSYSVVGTISAPGMTTSKTVTVNVNAKLSNKEFTDGIVMTTGQIYDNEIQHTGTRNLIKGDGLDVFRSAVAGNTSFITADELDISAAYTGTWSSGLDPHAQAMALAATRKYMYTHYPTFSGTQKIKFIPDQQSIVDAGTSGSIATAMYGASVPSVYDEWYNNPRGADYYMYSYPYSGTRYKITLPASLTYSDVRISVSGHNVNPATGSWSVVDTSSAFLSPSEAHLATAYAGLPFPTEFPAALSNPQMGYFRPGAYYTSQKWMLLPVGWGYTKSDFTSSSMESLSRPLGTGPWNAATEAFGFAIQKPKDEAVPLMVSGTGSGAGKLFPLGSPMNTKLIPYWIRSLSGNIGVYGPNGFVYIVATTTSGDKYTCLIRVINAPGVIGLDFSAFVGLNGATPPANMNWVRGSDPYSQAYSVYYD